MSGEGAIVNVQAEATALFTCDLLSEAPIKYNVAPENADTR
jgi:hypothetical protein